MKQLFISDLDKTLLRSDMSVSHFTEKTWNRVVETGLNLTIATARSAPKTLQLLENLTLNLPLIVMDGAMIIAPNGDILTLCALGEKEADPIIACSREFDLTPFIIGFDEQGIEHFCYSAPLNHLQEELLTEYREDKRLIYVQNLKALKQNVKIVCLGAYAPLKGLYDRLQQRFGTAIEVKLAKDSYLDGYFLTILHPEGDKAHALQKMVEMQTLQDHTLHVFGDSLNDLGMFRLAHHKFAVANALEEVKKAATLTLPHTNDEDAVARFLLKHYHTSNT